jgi:NADH-quinone oxidoreductase subunit F
LDLKLTAQAPTDAERRAVDAVLGPAPADEPTLSAADAKARRHLLLPVLNSLQAQIGWVSPTGLNYACRRLGVPPAEAFGVASFYALLSLSERPKAFAHVCDDIACQAAGAERLCQQVEQKLGPAAHAHHRADANGHDKPGRWARSPCLGLCEQAPAALVTVAAEKPIEQSFGQATVESIETALDGKKVSSAPLQIGSLGPRRLLKRVGTADPTSLDAYKNNGGYEALRRAFELGPDATVREVTEAKLVGRGGAAFPTGRKWDAVAKATARPHYVICNADESEPGTFKDRVLLEEDPFAIVESMTIAGFATGCEHGFIYLRGEYPLAAKRLQGAIDEAKAKGLLGGDVMGKGVKFELELRRGAGAYICGEETALFNSIEGLRGEPRNKPPFPVQSGLFHKPTAINNVETLAAVLTIVGEGAKAYASVGTPASPGTKLFCVSGRVKRPGIYEVPFGTRLDALLELCGGAHANLKGVLMGGAAGGFIGPDKLSVQLSFEHTKEAGTTLGSGVVFVIDDTVPVLPMLRRLAEFFRDESCGQCVPCRVGTVRQEELLARLAAKRPLGSREAELKLFDELAAAMRDASICGLGQTASSAIESAFKVFPLEGL